MYNFIFYFVYKFRERRTSDLSDAKFTAGLGVLFTLIFHLLFIGSCFRYFLDYEKKFFDFTSNKQLNNIVLVLIGMSLIVFITLFYNKTRTKRILAKYDERIYNIFSIKNVILFLRLHFFH